MKKLTTRQRALAAGYRSGLEEEVAADLDKLDIPYKYEEDIVYYEKPARKSRYTPDFVLNNAIIIETKGRFVTADRQKHLLIKSQHPGLDIRFVFSNPNSRISKGSKTTYAMWCEKHGFEYNKRSIPLAWLREGYDHDKMSAVNKAGIK